MLNALKTINIWATLRNLRIALDAAELMLGSEREKNAKLIARLNRLEAALDTIEALRTPNSSGTVNKIARIVAEARQ